jgi:hypothetical protein
LGNAGRGVFCRLSTVSLAIEIAAGTARRLGERGGSELTERLLRLGSRLGEPCFASIASVAMWE